MIRVILYFAVVLVIFSCQSIEKAAKPETIIDEDRMVEILTEIAFIKAAKSSYRKNLNEKNFDAESYILKKFDIDSTVFAQNNAWYADQLETYEKIFERVKTNLKQEEVKYEKLKKREDSIKKVEDSIKKAKDALEAKEKLGTKDQIEKEIANAKKKRITTPSENE